MVLLAFACSFLSWIGMEGQEGLRVNRQESFGSREYDGGLNIDSNGASF